MANAFDGKITGKLVSSLVKVRLDEDPKEGALPKTMFQNERLHFQIAYKSTLWYTLGETQIEVSGTLAPYIMVREVENVPVRFTPYPTDDYYLGGVGLYPDVIKPFSSLGLVLPPHVWRAVWVRVFAKEGLPAGKHTLALTLKTKEGEILCHTPYEIEVLEDCLPDNPLRITNWMHYDCICHKHGVQPFTEQFYDVFSAYLEAYVESGCNMLLTPLFTPPLDTAVGTERDAAQLIEVERANGEYHFGFEKLRRFIRFAQKYGVQYFEFAHLFTQWGGSACPKILVKEDGFLQKAFGWETESTSNEYSYFLSTLLPKLVAFLKEEGIKENCYLHLTDEPRAEHAETYAKCANLVKTYADGLPVMDAISHKEYFEQGLVDIPVCYTPTFSAFAEVAKERLFIYYCGGPTDGYYSNRFINLPALRTRILGAQLYETGVAGFLHWGFNFYNTYLSLEQVDPYAVTDAGYYYPAGDGFIVYPWEGGVYTSIRAELQTEAMQDYRALKLLEMRVGRKAVQNLLKEYGVSGLTEYPKEEGIFVELREKVNEAIRRAK